MPPSFIHPRLTHSLSVSVLGLRVQMLRWSEWPPISPTCSAVATWRDSESRVPRLVVTSTSLVAGEEFISCTGVHSLVAYMYFIIARLLDDESGSFSKGWLMIVTQELHPCLHYNQLHWPSLWILNCTWIGGVGACDHTLAPVPHIYSRENLPPFQWFIVPDYLTIHSSTVPVWYSLQCTYNVVSIEITCDTIIQNYIGEGWGRDNQPKRHCSCRTSFHLGMFSKIV